MCTGARAQVAKSDLLRRGMSGTETALTAWAKSHLDGLLLLALFAPKHSSDEFINQSL